MDVKVLLVVKTELKQRGNGTPENPFRTITQYWSLDGQLLAEVDAWKEAQSRHVE